jgi:ATP adenylyltransferase
MTESNRNRVFLAPWRMGYIMKPEEKGCFLCRLTGKDDFLLYKSRHALAVLNTYPYNNGHLLVAPAKHKKSLSQLIPEEAEELYTLLAKSIQILERTMHPHGFNVGLNLGKCAGAGLQGHFHFHIVPRWQGDTNFMPVTAGVKVIPQSLEELWKILKVEFDAIRISNSSPKKHRKR